jgi:hypothetical protein
MESRDELTTIAGVSHDKRKADQVSRPAECHHISYVSHTSVFSVAGSAMALQWFGNESAMIRKCIYMP